MCDALGAHRLGMCDGGPRMSQVVVRHLDGCMGHTEVGIVGHIGEGIGSRGVDGAGGLQGVAMSCESECVHGVVVEGRGRISSVMALSHMVVYPAAV